MERTDADLKMLQALPLDIKVAMSCTRIRAWVNEFGEDGVYVSFSGGKDSTVLLDLVRNVCGFTDVRAMFVDVPTQYPELKAFVKTFDKVDIVKPKISFVEVCKKYGFPLISKEVAEALEAARRYVNGNEKSVWGYNKMTGEGRYKDTQFSRAKYAFLIDAPFNCSPRCCKIMKKAPAHAYERETGRRPILAMMAAESKLRLLTWKRYGCNGFEAERPTSNPMSFWTENDVLAYIARNNLPICSVYGDVVPADGQLAFGIDTDIKYTTTGCKRTGCMLCGFGVQSESTPNRFEQLKETHAGMYKLLDTCTNNGVTFREAIEWCNDHGGLDIRL